MSLPLRWVEIPVSEETAAASSGEPEAQVRPRNSVRFSAIALVLAAALGVFATIGIQQISSYVAATGQLRFEGGAAGHQVASTIPSAERRLGFITVTGAVSNRIERPLENVEAIVELLDEQHRTIQVESAMVAFDAIPPGQASPFRVELPDNIRAAGYRVEFRKLSGAPLD